MVSLLVRKDIAGRVMIMSKAKRLEDNQFPR